MLNCVIWTDNLVAFIAERFNTEELQSGGLHERHAVAAGNLGTISAFA
jgi:hypothetical protein